MIDFYKSVIERKRRSFGRFTQKLIKNSISILHSLGCSVGKSASTMIFSPYNQVA